jgi:putative membrane protein insertion efficiency factor
MPRTSGSKLTTLPPSSVPSGNRLEPRRLNALALGLLALVGAYKVLISPLFAGSCRYQPSCSDYMSEAVATHGALRGAWLGARRLSRCHPFGGHGVDPVPRA